MDTKDILLIVVSIIGVLLTLLGFFLRYWFNVTNDSQYKIIDDLGNNRVTLAEQNASIEKLGEQNKEAKERNNEYQKNMFKEIHKITLSMDKSLERVSVRVEQNRKDIDGLKLSTGNITSRIKYLEKKNEK